MDLVDLAEVITDEQKAENFLKVKGYSENFYSMSLLWQSRFW